MVAPISLDNLYTEKPSTESPKETFNKDTIEGLANIEKPTTPESITSLGTIEKEKTKTTVPEDIPAATSNPLPIVDKTKGKDKAKKKTHIIQNPGDTATAYGDKNEEIFITEVETAHGHK